MLPFSWETSPSLVSFGGCKLEDSWGKIHGACNSHKNSIYRNRETNTCKHSQLLGEHERLGFTLKT